MTASILSDAFGHHIWATQQLLDTCRSLTPEQLETTSPGTFGSIIDTLRHILAGDYGYLFALSGGQTPLIDEADMTVADLRSAIDANAARWAKILDQDLDPETTVIRYRDDGSESHAPLGIRLAQALHHGTDHRSQVCTILTVIGVTPPAIDVWDYADKDGRLSETEPTS